MDRESDGRNLFMNNSATVDMDGEHIGIDQVTEYPWSGKIVINVNPEKHKVFSMMIRVPGWATNQALPSDLYRFKSTDQSKVSIKVNNRNFKYDIKNGYAVISREWKKGDQLLVDLQMAVREIKAHDEIKDDAGKV